MREALHAWIQVDWALLAEVHERHSSLTPGEVVHLAGSYTDPGVDAWGQGSIEAGLRAMLAMPVDTRWTARTMRKNP